MSKMQHFISYIWGAEHFCVKETCKGGGKDMHTASRP